MARKAHNQSQRPGMPIEVLSVSTAIAHRELHPAQALQRPMPRSKDSATTKSLDTGTHSTTRRSRKALPTTDTELKLMAAAAMIGLRRIPNAG